MRAGGRSFPPGGPDRDLRRAVEQELAFHFRRTVEGLMEKGLSREEAEARALERFGDVAGYTEDLVRIDEGRREMERRAAWISTVAQGLAFTLRSIRRSPGFALAVVLTLALGIGANATMFNVVDRLLLRPPDHVLSPDRVRHIYIQRAGIDGVRTASRWMTFPDYRDLERVAAFQQVAGYTTPLPATLGTGDEARKVTASKASASLFPLLGARPALGRFYRPDEDAVGAPGTAVLSYGFWQRRFGGDPEVLGRDLMIGEGRYTVVGVAPKGFTGAEIQRVDLWLPLETAQAVENGTRWRTGENARNWWWMNGVARLAPGASSEEARVQATAVHRGARAEMESYDPEAEVLVAPIIAARGPDPSAEARVSRLLAGVSLIVLLVACANVANLLMARGVRRRREMAVRRALGIDRARLTTQLLVEVLVLAGLGTAAALLLARWTGGVVQQVLLPDVALGDGFLWPRLLAFAGLATLLTVLLAGLVPAFRTAGQDVGQALKAGGRAVHGERSRLRTGLLVLQAALSVVLLVGAGLFVRSLLAARNQNLGFDAEGLVVARVEWSAEDASQEPAARRAALLERARVYRRALEELRRLPQVTSVATTYSGPFWSSISVGRPLLEGGDTVPRSPGGGPYLNLVSSGYFETMGLDMVSGRPFLPEDYAQGAGPVTVVTESMARASWPHGGALGRCLFIPLGGDDPPCTRVVGVVENHRRDHLVEEEAHFMYFLTGNGLTAAPQGLVIRARGEASDGLAATLRQRILGLDGRIRFVNVRSYEEMMDPMLRSWRLGASMFVVFGLLALLVAAVGLYSVLAFDVVQRQRELGLRAALGADGRSLWSMILRRAVLLVAIGTGLGLAVALLLGPMTRDLLFQVSPVDPAVMGGVTAILMVVAGLGGALPAWRATLVDPMEALRAE